MNSRFSAPFVALCLVTASAFAASAGELKQRMDQRLAQIDNLKKEEIVGENNRGFLEERKPGAGTTVTEENQDREAVYALLAKQTGSTPDAVGRARAKQIAANSRPGVWVQDEGGAWKKK
jgi:uncharacterized protein